MRFAQLPEADDIVEWAARVRATEDLPRLVRRLIGATTEFTSLAFRAGAGIRYPGWDGLAEVTKGNAWVPVGLSSWEMGVNREPKGNADDDYEKRTAEMPPGDRKSTAFVFVTPRRWRDGKDWADGKGATADWASVRVIDADDLEAWLEQALHVHLWLSERINGRVHGIRTLEAVWERWSEATTPALPPALLVAGRDAQARQVRDWVDGIPAVHSLQGSSVDESVAFIASALFEPDLDVNPRQLRSLVVSDSDSWDEVITTLSPLILIPRFEEPHVKAATRAGHHVLNPLGSEATLAAHVILPELAFEAAQGVFEAIGVDQEAAERYAGAARRNLLAFRRGLATDAPLSKPVWAKTEAGRLLVPALLAGSWDQDTTGDCEILGKLSGRPYGELEAELQPWTRTDDPPVRVRGAVWALTNREDAWTQLSGFITNTDWTRLVEVAIEVLMSPDPSWELPADERWAAAVRGKPRVHSSYVLRGIAEPVAMLGSWPRLRDLSAGRSGPQLADMIVRQVLDHLNDDPSGRNWASLGDLLPFLAEAAPDLFLAAARLGATGDDPPLRRLMLDAESGGIFGRASHAGLLWALETLAWSPDYLAPVALLLVRLASLDPGGRWANRPANSFREIFLPWLPQTSATLEQRLTVLDALRAAQAEVATRLLKSLLPSHLDHSAFTARPRWRTWAPDRPVRVSVEERQGADRAVAGWLIEDACGDPGRLAELVEAFSSIPPDLDDQLVDALDALDPASLAPEAHERLVDALRKTVGEHRAYSDAAWAVDPARIERLSRSWIRLGLGDPIARNRWLFSGHPRLDSVIGADYQKYDTALAELRVRALDELLDMGWASVAELAARAEEPWTVGWTLGTLERDSTERATDWLDDDERHLQAACGYMAARTWKYGWEWAEGVLSRVARMQPAPVMGRLISAASRDPVAWALAERLGPVVERSYWERFWGYPDGEVANRAAEKLLAFGRPYVAVDILGQRLDDVPAFDADLANRALLAAAQLDPPASSNDQVMFRHYLGRLLPPLRASGLEASAVARLEWLFLPLVDDEQGTRELTLYRELATNPAFFVEIVSTAFRATHERPAKADPAVVRIAERAFQLLLSWRQAPGVADGVIDEEALRAWVFEARRLLEEADRHEIGDQRIGHILCHVPAAADGIWPHEAVRRIVEEVGSDDLDLGLEVEKSNLRGVTTRGAMEGGGQERELARHYAADAAALGPRWSRAARILRSLADDNERMAKRWDVEADLREDRIGT